MVCLEPFLFLVYINDIVNDIDNDFLICRSRKGSCCGSNFSDGRLENVMSNWAKKWTVQFNSQKTKKILYLVEGTGSTDLYSLD